MAPKTVSVTVKLSKPGIQPPIFLAGSFSDPAWQPQEMQHTTNESGDYEFHREVQVEAGKEYQYKFRIGEQGDWWMLNEESPTVTDDAGNRNNLLSIPVDEEIAHEPKQSKTAEIYKPEEPVKPSSTEMAEEVPKEHGEEKGAADVPAVEEPLTPVSIAKEEEESGKEIEESKAADIPATHESIESSSIGTGEDTPKTTDEEDGTPEVHTNEGAIEPVDVTKATEVEESHPPQASTTEETIKPSSTEIDGDIHKKAEEESGPSEPYTVEEPPEPIVITKGEEHAKAIEEPEEAAGITAEETVAPAKVLDEESFVEELDHKLEASTEDLSKPISTPATEEIVKEPDHTPETLYLHLPEGSIEPTSTPAIEEWKVLAEPAEETRSEETDNVPEIESPSPITVVEKTGLEPRHGDDFGAEATFAQKEAHHLRAQGALPDYIRVRHESRTPELADIAAEVADSAALLDRDQPTPEISNEEAGRIGFRRMSQTPIPQVASTAAEVADIAATLDRESIEEIEVTPAAANNEREEDEVAPAAAHDAREDDEIPLPSGASTPEEERAPLLPHECLSKPPAHSGPCKHQRHEPLKPRKPSPPRFEEYDPNDPSIEVFPTEREAFFERLRKISERLPEDVTDVDIEPLSPSIGASAQEEKNLQKPSPSMLAHQISPSLDAITEENDEGEELLSSVPASSLENTNGETNGLSNKEIKTPEIKVEPAPEVTGVVPENIPSEHTDLDGASPEASPNFELPMTPFGESNQQLGGENDAVREIVTEASLPNITIQPATPFLENKGFGLDRPQVTNTNNDEPSTNIKSAPPVEESGSSSQEETSKTTQVEPAPEEANVGIKGPGVTFEESAPGESTKTDDKPADTAKSTGIEEENGHGQLKSRRQQSPERPERPLTPSSVRSAGKDPKSKNFLEAFWRVVFVDWIGGLIMRLCGGSRGRT